MNSGLKQRLVGALVLVCGGVILWPLLFSSSGIGPGMDRHTQIPAMPEFDKFAVEEPSRPQNIQPVAEPQPEAEPPVDQAPPAPPAPAPDKASAPPATSTPALDSRGLPEGWLLQVASFTEPKNAEQLSEQLQKQGYKAFVRRIETRSGTVERVYIGPRMSKDAFAADRPKIDKKYRVKSIVVQYEP